MSKGKKRKIRKPGEHWYQIICAFDPQSAKVLPVAGEAVALGVLEDMIIVQVPKNVTAESIETVRKYLRNQGMKSHALFIPEGMKFMKLDSCSGSREKRLDEALAEALDKEEREAAEKAAEKNAQQSEHPGS